MSAVALWQWSAGAIAIGAVATALLLGLIARDDVSMTAYMVRVDALSAARLDFRGWPAPNPGASNRR